MKKVAMHTKQMNSAAKPAVFKKASPAPSSGVGCNAGGTYNLRPSPKLCVVGLLMLTTAIAAKVIVNTTGPKILVNDSEEKVALISKSSVISWVFEEDWGGGRSLSKSSDRIPVLVSPESLS
jgi:hypothetical protein